jgi:hypothetical protein
MTFIKDMQITRSMSPQLVVMASMIGAFGTSPCSPSSVKAGVSWTSLRMM